MIEFVCETHEKMATIEKLVDKYTCSERCPCPDDLWHFNRTAAANDNDRFVTVTEMLRKIPRERLRKHGRDFILFMSEKEKRDWARLEYKASIVPIVTKTSSGKTKTYKNFKDCTLHNKETTGVSILGKIIER